LNKNCFTLLAGLDKQLLIKLGGLDHNVPNVANISLAVCCQALKLCKLPTATLDAFDEIRFEASQSDHPGPA